MGYSYRMDLIVSDVPKAVLASLAEDAEKVDASLNDMACRAIARALGMEYEPTGAKFRSSPSSTRLMLDLPEAMHMRIRMMAASSPGATMRGVIVAMLAKHYKLPVPSIAKRPRSARHTHR